MNHVTHSYRDCITLPAKEATDKSGTIGIVALMVWVILMLGALVTYAPSIIAVGFASLVQ